MEGKNGILEKPRKISETKAKREEVKKNQHSKRHNVHPKQTMKCKTLVVIARTH